MRSKRQKAREKKKGGVEHLTECRGPENSNDR